MDAKEPIELKRLENTGIVTFKTACISDVESISTTNQMIKDFIEIYKPVKLIFNFENVKFFSSQVLGLILEIRSILKNHSGELVISAINPQLYRVFRITNLDKIFSFFPDIDSAVKN